MNKFVFTELEPRRRNDLRHLWIGNDGRFSVYLCHPDSHYQVQAHVGTCVRKDGLIPPAFDTRDLTVANLVAMDVMEQFMYHRPRDRLVAHDILNELSILYKGHESVHNLIYIANQDMCRRLRHPRVMPVP